MIITQKQQEYENERSNLHDYSISRICIAYCWCGLVFWRRRPQILYDFISNMVYKNDRRKLEAN